MICNDMEIAISVVVPVYNSEKYLPRCIESILSQSFSDFELILVNDGSCDSSGGICDAYAQKDARIRVIHKQNAGVSAARNDGIDAARGMYLTFIDSDDYVEPDFLEYALHDIQQNSVDMYISGLRMETYQENEMIHSVEYCSKTSRSVTTRELLEEVNSAYPQICICGPWCKLYAANVIKKNDIRFLKELNCGEDTYFNLCVLEKIDQIYFSSDWFYHYCRSNEESLFGRFHPDTYEIHTLVYDRMRELMGHKGCSTEAMTRFEGMYFSLLVGGIHEYYRYSEKTTIQDQLTQIRKVAENAHVRKIKCTTVVGIRYKCVLLLLRFRMIWAVWCIFYIYYKIRHGKQTKKH